MTLDDRATLLVQRRFEPAPVRLFDVWVDPERVQKWMKDGYRADGVNVDWKARVGRSFRLAVQRGGEEVIYSGEYMDVVRPRRLVFTWVAPAVSKETTLVTVDFSPVPSVWGGTDLTLKHERVIPADVGRAEARWNSVLDSIAAML